MVVQPSFEPSRLRDCREHRLGERRTERRGCHNDGASSHQVLIYREHRAVIKTDRVDDKQDVNVCRDDAIEIRASKLMATTENIPQTGKLVSWLLLSTGILRGRSRRCVKCHRLHQPRSIPL